MLKRQTIAAFLLLKGLFFLALAVIDWLTAKTAVSERHYLLPACIVIEFLAAIRAALQGEFRLPLTSGMHVLESQSQRSAIDPAISA